MLFRSGWDEELLALELADLRDLSFDLSTIGFSDNELQSLPRRIDNPTQGLTDPDEVPQEPEDKDVWVKPGDLFVLGDHRLLCGDSTNPEDVERLMDGAKAVLLSTDPPYLVNYQGGQHPDKGRIAGENWKTGKRAANWDEYHGPETSVEFYAGFLAWHWSIWNPTLRSTNGTQRAVRRS